MTRLALGYSRKKKIECNRTLGGVGGGDTKFHPFTLEIVLFGYNKANDNCYYRTIGYKDVSEM